MSLATSLCTLVTLYLAPGGPVATPAPGSIHGVAPEASEPRSSSGWLREAARLDAQGEHAQAGDAYREALLALSERAQRGEEGATAALLAAKTHWRAFDRDPEAARLAAGVEVLELWLALTGTRDAALVDEVRGELERLHAILDPLRAGDVALEAGDATAAFDHYDAALDALARRPRDWSTGASLVVRIADRFVARYDASFGSGADVETHLGELRSARRMLESWGTQQPPGEGERSKALAHALAGIRGRLAEAERATVDPPWAPPPPPPLPTRPIVAKGTGLLVGASVTTGLAWVGALVRSGAAVECDAGEYWCRGEAGSFVIALTPLGWGLGASSYVLGPLAGARRGAYDGVAAGWDGAPQRKARALKGFGAALLGIGVAGRVASVALWFSNFDLLGYSGHYDGSYMTFHPFIAQLSSSAISAGGGILAYGIAYDEHRASELQRSRLAGVTHPSNDARSGWRLTGVTVVSAGLVVTGAGAALLAKGVDRWHASTEEAAAAASLEAMYDGVYGTDADRYDDAGFAADLRVARRSISGLLMGGYVLVASGVATSVVGLTLLANARPASRSKRRAWVRPSTVVSPGLSMLTLSGRF